MTDVNSCHRGVQLAREPMLIVFGGLPGTGKTTVSRAVAGRCLATYLRIDLIEHVIRTATDRRDIGAVGYDVAQALAASNLTGGQIIVADCVNPVTASRESWRLTAARAGAVLVEIEAICSDLIEHRRRVERRRSDIDGFRLPSWSDILAHDYEVWHQSHVIIDTAQQSVEEAVAVVEEAIARSFAVRMHNVEN